MTPSITINIIQLADKAEETGTVPVQETEELASELEQDGGWSAEEFTDEEDWAADFEPQDEEEEDWAADEIMSEDEAVQAALASRFASKMRRIARGVSRQGWSRRKVASEL